MKWHIQNKQSICKRWKHNFFKLKGRKDFTESLASIGCETADRRNATTLTMYFCSLAMMGI